MPTLEKIALVTIRIFREQVEGIEPWRLRQILRKDFEPVTLPTPATWEWQLPNDVTWLPITEAKAIHDLNNMSDRLCSTSSSKERGFQ